MDGTLEGSLTGTNEPNWHKCRLIRLPKGVTKHVPKYLLITLTGVTFLQLISPPHHPHHLSSLNVSIALKPSE
jgi:hypothetical protein